MGAVASVLVCWNDYGTTTGRLKGQRRRALLDLDDFILEQILWRAASGASPADTAALLTVCRRFRAALRAASMRHATTAQLLGGGAPLRLADCRALRALTLPWPAAFAELPWPGDAAERSQTVNGAAAAAQTEADAAAASADGDSVARSLQDSLAAPLMRGDRRSARPEGHDSAAAAHSRAPPSRAPLQRSMLHAVVAWLTQSAQEAPPPADAGPKQLEGDSTAVVSADAAPPPPSVRWPTMWERIGPSNWSTMPWLRAASLGESSLSSVAFDPSHALLFITRLSLDAAVPAAELRRLTALTTLQALSLGRQVPCDAAASALGALPTLQTLEIESAVSAAAMRRLTRCVGLRHLRLGGAAAFDGAPGTSYPFAALPRLEALEVQHELPEGCLPDASGAPALRQLHLRAVPVLAPPSLARLASLTTLQDLLLAGVAELPVNALASVAQLKALRKLALERCGAAADPGFVYVCGLPALRALHLTECPFVDDPALAWIAHMRDLRSLRLRDCDSVSDYGIAHLTTLKALEELDISGIDVTDAIANLLPHIYNLARLDLSRLGVSAECVELIVERFTLYSAPLHTLLLPTRCADRLGRTERWYPRAVLCGAEACLPLETYRSLRAIGVCPRCVSPMFADEWAQVAGAPQLQTLLLQRLTYCADGIAHVAASPSLRCVTFCDCDLPDAALEVLAGSAHIEALVLLGCRGLTDGGVEALGRMARLREVGVHDCPGVGGGGLLRLAQGGDVRVMGRRECEGRLELFAYC